MNRSPWRLEEVDGSPWRLEEVDGGDEQYPVESRFAVRHTPPDEQDPRFDRSAPTQVCFVRFAVCHSPPDQHDPGFDRRRSVSSVLRYARPLPMNRIPFERGRSNTRSFPLFCGAPGLVSIAYSVQALPMNTTTHSVSTQPVGSHAFRCLPMNTTHSVASR